MRFRHPWLLVVLAMLFSVLFGAFAGWAEKRLAEDSCDCGHPRCTICGKDEQPSWVDAGARA